MTKETIVYSPDSQLDKVLDTVANHMFVTSESYEKRDDLRVYLRTITSTLNKLGCEEVVCFPAGSSAVGMAVKSSDSDGQIFYNNPEPFSIETSTDLASWSISGVKVEGNQGGKGEVEVEWAGEYISEAYVEKEMDEAFDELHPRDPENLATFFYPSLNEFKDKREKQIVDKWRKRILETIISTNPERAEAFWDIMRQFLKQRMILYTDEGGETYVPFLDRTIYIDPGHKRERRVKRIFNKAIKERFSDRNEIKRAQSFIQSKRASLEYPTFNQMLEAFNVQKWVDKG